MSKVKRALKWSGVALGVIVLLIVVVVAVLHTPPGRRFVLSQVTGILDDQNIGFDSSDLNYNLFDLSFALRDVTVSAADYPEAPTFLEIERLEADLGLMALIGGRYVLESGDVQGLSVHYFVDENGRDNIPRPPSDPDAPSEPIDYLIEQLKATDSTVRYENRAQEMDVLLPIQTLSMDGDAATGRHAIEVRASDGTVQAQERRATIDRLIADLDLGDDDVTFETVVLEAEGSRAELSGTLTSFEAPKVDARLQADLDVERAARLGGLEDPAGGRLVVDARAEGPIDTLQVNAQVDGRDLRFRNVNQVGLEVDAGYDMGTGVATADDLQLNAPWGRVAGSGVVATEQGPSRVSLQVDGIDVAQLMRALDMPQRAATRLEGSIDASWPALEYTAATGSADLSLTPTQQRPSDSTIPVGGRLTVNAEQGRAVARIANLSAAGARVDGQVSLRDQTDLGGSLRARVADVGATVAMVESFLARPAGSLSPVPVSGALTADVTLGGTVSAPAAAASVSAPSLDAGEAADMALRADARYSPDAAVLERLDLTWGEARVTASGRLGLTGAQPLSAQFDVARLRVPAVLTLAGQSDIAADGTLSVSGTAAGTLSEPRAAASLRANDLVVSNEPLGALAAEVQLAGQQVTIDQLVLDKPQPGTDGRLVLTGRYGIDSGAYAFDLESSNLELVSLTLPDGRPLRGSLALSGSGTGTVSAPEATVNVAADGLTLGEHELGRVALDARVADGTAVLDLDADRFSTTVDARVGINSPYPSTVQARIAGLDLGTLPVTLPASLTGTVSADVNATADLEQPAGAQVDARIASLEGEWNGQPFALDGPAVVAYAGERLTIDRLRVTARDSSLSVTGNLPLTDREGPGAIELDARANLATLAEYVPAETALTAGGQLQISGTVRGTFAAIDPTLDVRIDDAAVSTPDIAPGLTGVTARARVADGAATVEQLVANWGAAVLELTAQVPFALLPELPVEIPRQAGNARVNARVQNFDPGTAPGAPAELSGNISLTADVSAASAELGDVTGTVSFSDLSVAYQGLELAQRGTSTIDVADGIARIARFNLAGSAGTLQAQGTVGLLENRPLDVAVDGAINMGVIGSFAEGVQAEGEASLDVAATGTLDAPELSGSVAMSDVRLAMDDPTIAVENLTARVDLAGERVTVTTLTGELNGGTFTGSGGLSIGGEGVSDVDLRLAADDVAFSAPLDLRSLSAANLQVTEREGNILVNGKVTIKEAGLTGDIKFDQGVLASLTAPRALDLTEERNATLERVAFNVQVVTETPIIIDNNLARAEITTDVRLLGTPYETGLSGRMSILEGGEIVINERRYAVERGTITFLDERRITPSFDLQLTTTASRYDVTLSITGEPDDTETALTSNPALPEPDIMALLVTGRTLDEMRGEEGDIAREQMLSYLGGRMGSRLGRGLERATGLSEVRIEPNLIASEADPGARLTIGQDLTDRLKLIYSTDLADSNDQILVARFDATRRFQTNAVSQADGSYRFDFQHDVRAGGRPAPGRIPRSRPTISAIDVPTTDVLSEAELRDAFDLEVGEPFDYFSAREGVDRIEAALRERGHLESRVRLERAVTDASVALSLQVRPGPVVTLAYEGVTPPSKVVKEVRRQWTRGVFDTQRGADAAAALRAWLIGDNYLDSKVEYDIDDPSPGTRRVTFTIVPGTRFNRIERVFAGASGVSPDTLDDIVDEQDLERELFTDPVVVTELLQRYYREEGYLVAEVETPRYEYEGETARAIIDVTEGPRFTVGTVSVTGNTVFTSPALVAELPVVAGDPFLPAAAERAHERIREMYWDRAYNDVRSDYELALNRDTGVVDVTFQVEEGIKSVVADVVIAGTDETSTRLVREQVALEQGEPLDLGVLGRSRRNLYDTGAFSIVDITRTVVSSPGGTAAPGATPTGEATAPASVATGAAQVPVVQPPANPTADQSSGSSQATASGQTAPAEAAKDVRLDVAVREVQPFQLRYGASYDTERGIGGIVDLSNRNSLGKARVVGVAARYAARLRDARLYMSQPSLRYAPTQTSGNIYYRSERNDEGQLIDAFNVDRYGISVQRERELRNAYLWTYGYRYERARKFATGTDSDFDETIAVSPLTSTFTRETRDELLDASTGSFTGHAFSYSPGWLGADAPYVKYYGQYFRYVPLEPFKRKRFTNEILRPRFVYAAGVRFGLAKGIGGGVPETERFYAGGSTTLRGFEQNAVGPIDADRIPTGGDAMFVLNNEIRFPIVSIFDGVGFLDIGNVFDGVSDFSFTDFRETAGVGLRVRTPWLLIRGDYGFVLDPRPGESRSRLYFSIGQAF